MFLPVVGCGYHGDSILPESTQASREKLSGAGARISARTLANAEMRSRAAAQTCARRAFLRDARLLNRLVNLHKSSASAGINHPRRGERRPG